MGNWFAAGSRWRGLVNGPMLPPARAKDLRATPTLNAGAALVLRLRIGLGVGIKADVVGLLVGFQGSRHAVQAIAVATGYTTRAVRRALEEMTAARLLRTWQTAPATYSADFDAWSHLLALPPDDPPAWRHWHPVFAFVAALDSWCSSAETRVASRYIQSSGARDLMERHRAAFELNHLSVPRHEDSIAEEYLEPFAETVGALADWMKSSA